MDWGLLFAPWVVEAGPPVAVQLHGSTGQIDFRDPSPRTALQGHVVRLLEVELLRAAPALHTHSTLNQREWERLTGRRVRSAPPPVPLAERRLLPGPREDWGLVVGRVQTWKGPDVLCEALRSLGDRAPHVRWAGRDTVHGESGRSMTALLGETYPDVWGTTVEPVGQVSTGRVAELQARAGFVVVPSLWDVYNLTAVEAMQAGAVVVCSLGAGAADVIEDGSTGFLFPAGDAAALAAALERVRQLSADDRTAIGSAAARAVREALDPAAVARDKADAYTALGESGPTFAPSPWAEAAVRAEAVAPAPPLAFLDQFALRDVLTHTARRIRGKLTPER